MNLLGLHRWIWIELIWALDLSVSVKQASEDLRRKYHVGKSWIFDLVDWKNKNYIYGSIFAMLVLYIMCYSQDLSPWYVWFVKVTLENCPCWENDWGWLGSCVCWNGLILSKTSNHSIFSSSRLANLIDWFGFQHF